MNPVAYEGNRPYIFLSYSHEDSAYVLPFIHVLQTKYNVWFDEYIQYGAEWAEYVAEKLAGCAVFFFIITPNSLASDNCMDEIAYARDLKKFSVNIYKNSDIVLPRAFQMRYGRYQMCKLDRFATFEEAVADLAYKCAELREVGLDEEEACKEWHEIPYRREGGSVWFGHYPQEAVLDAHTVAALNELAGDVPTAQKSGRWTSYRYYIKGKCLDYMWYIDLEWQGTRYRGVYFDAYRPSHATIDSAPNTSNQDENGYLLHTAYWFRYSPIRWRVLCEKEGNALLFCETAIDSQDFYHSTAIRQIADREVYPNNYAHSTIRRWLNEDFLQAAFDRNERRYLVPATVANDPASTNPAMQPAMWNEGANPFACEDTTDRVFLLSEAEATRPEYGFSADCTLADPARRRGCTDYGRSQGCYTNPSTEYFGSYSWWLRSPMFFSNNFMHGVSYGGNSDGDSVVPDTRRGIVPALWLRTTNADD